MRTFLITLMMIFASQVVAEVNFPETKYEIADCISPTDPTWSWFGKTARVEDVVYSKKLKGFTYRLIFLKATLVSTDFLVFGLSICRPSN